MPTPDPVEEVGGRGATPDELDVHIAVSGVYVAQQAAVAVDVVEPRIALQLDAPARRGEALELAQRLTRVALPLAELRCVDLHETNPSAAREVERVAVAGAHDGRGPQAGLALRSATAGEHHRDDEHDER